MRVIAGLYKGRTLTTVNDHTVRPATDRVKQTIFDMLTTRLPFDGSTVLDLFAGSGSLGIEALSRGAAHVTFVELSATASECIERNLQMLRCEEMADVFEMDALQFVRKSRTPFDLIFADPPYVFESTTDLPLEILSRNLLTPGGYLIIEHARDVRFAPSALFRNGPQKRFGRTVVSFFQTAPA